MEFYNSAMAKPIHIQILSQEADAISQANLMPNIPQDFGEP